MTRSTILALALVLAASPLAEGGELEDAQALQQAGKFDEALPHFEAEAQADPSNAAAALGLSQVLAGLGRYDEAARAVDAAHRANPGDARLAVAKGRAYLLRMYQEERSDDPDGGLIEALAADAQRWAGEAIKIDPKNVDALLLRGELHQRDGNDDQARMFFEEAAKAGPGNFDAQFALANYWYGRAGRDNKNTDLWAKAESGFFTCWKLDPKSALAAANLAHCKAWQKGPPQDVAAAYLRALALAPNDEGLLKKAYAFMPRADRPAAFQKLSDEMPKDVNRKIYAAYAHMENRDFAKARSILEEASKLDPENPYIPLNEGDVVITEGKKPEDAVDLYVEAASLFKAKGWIPDGPYLKISATIAMENPSLTEEQREKLWTALWKMFPDRYDAANTAGLYYRDKAKDYKKSLEWYLRAVKVATDDACVQNDTGLIYHYHMHDFDKAEPYYRRAIAIGKEKGYDWNAPKPPGMGFRDAINNLAKILIEQKRWSDLKKFVEEDVPAEHFAHDLWLKQAEEKK